MSPRLYLIDGHALAYRAYFALSGGGTAPARWITSAGEPTAGVFGFTSILISLIEKEQPEYLAVAFDTGRTFRDDLYPEYKATREKMPEDLGPQIERIRQVVQAFGLPILEAEGFEADDVLGTIAKRAAAEGWEVVILTGDRDLLQLVDDRIRIRLAGRSLAEAADYTPEMVREQYGVSPEQFVDYKALVGDKSDNIPGVSGIGEKSAVELLRAHPTLESIYANLNEVLPRYRTKLEAGRADAELSRTLSAIRCDVPLALDLERCRVGQSRREEVVDLFGQLEFRSLLARLPGTVAAAAPGRQMAMFAEPARSTSQPATQTRLVTSEAELEVLAADMARAPLISFDLETTSTDPMRAEAVGLSVSISEGTGYYIPLRHAGGPNLPEALVAERLRGPLGQAGPPKTGHNVKYDYTMLQRMGVQVAPLYFDSMLAEWLCNPASRNLGLKELAFVRLRVEMTHIEALIGKGAKQITMDGVPAQTAAEYAAADADMALRLVAPLRAELESKGQLALLEELEMPLVPVLADMEMAGVKLDLPYLDNLQGRMQADLQAIEQEIHQTVGYTFNINSTQQLADALFGKLGLRPPDRSRKTAAGKFSTAADVLESLRHEHVVVEQVLRHRELSKLLSTYAMALPGAVNSLTGRVHTSYNQCGTVTGRISSSDPNLQNIPTRSDDGRSIRRAFIAEAGRVLVSIDYSQIELRIAAAMAKDAAMTAAFERGEDIHAATAAAVYGVKLTEVTSAMRRHAKAVNFGLLYGQSSYGLTRSTDLTLAEAEAFIKAYFERFPGIRAYIEETKRSAAELGYVQTLLGRRRYFPELQPGSHLDVAARNRAEREAINAPIQGTAADLIKRAMIALPQAMTRAGLAARMTLQVHDELVFECEAREVRDLARTAVAVMEGAYPLSVRPRADAKSGLNWEEMETVALS
ncbi:MAG: DNA polymerase I [Chloroflexi bacterium RBG_16_64_43]|nr:MAG: DNA polymerase I [Chloroflexi bacterium RBG_16_64_43]